VRNPLVIELWIGILSETELVTPIFDGVSSAEDGTPNQTFAVLCSIHRT